MFTENYKGCQVFISDEEGKTLTNSLIREYDQGHRIITIPTLNNVNILNKIVGVRIVTEDAICEYRGRVFRSRLDALMLDISLFKGQELSEGRASKRFYANASAFVIFMVVDNKKMPLLSPLAVTVVNISATGVLLRARSYALSQGDTIEIDLNIDGNPLVIQGKVVRINTSLGNDSEYGCKLIAVKEED